MMRLPAGLSSGENASGLPGRLSQLTRAPTSWMSTAPRAGFVTGGSANSGVDSVNPSRPPLSSDGRRLRSSAVTTERKAGESRAISRIGPPGTLSSAVLTAGSVPISIVP